MYFVKDSLRKQLAEESKYEEEAMCFILCQSCGSIFQDKMKIAPNEEDIAFEFKKGEFIGSFIGNSVGYSVINYRQYSDNNLHKRISFSFELNGKKENIGIVYYYGRCLK